MFLPSVEPVAAEVYSYVSAGYECVPMQVNINVCV